MTGKKQQRVFEVTPSGTGSSAQIFKDQSWKYETGLHIPKYLYFTLLTEVFKQQ